MSPNPTPIRVFGEIPGVPVGRVFASRADLASAGVHRPLMKGISGAGAEGADSIVLSGGYEDDRDFGDLILYTGEGGRDTSSGRQVADQALTRGNLALARNADQGLPVRVVRGANAGSEHAPARGYRYDGLFFVEDYWRERGSSGYFVWRFRLRREPPVAEPAPASPPTDAEPPQRRASTIQRIVRNTAMAQRVKELHDFRCQVCGTRLETVAGAYAEGAHVRPLGSPHDGPDSEDNILCLCPNHHVLFDRGGFAVADDLTLIGIEGRLRTVPGHSPGRQHLAYHRECYLARD